MQGKSFLLVKKKIFIVHSWHIYKGFQYFYLYAHYFTFDVVLQEDVEYIFAVFSVAEIFYNFKRVNNIRLYIIFSRVENRSKNDVTQSCTGASQLALAYGLHVIISS